jgi:hypothetical protein
MLSASGRLETFSTQRCVGDGFPCRGVDQIHRRRCTLRRIGSGEQMGWRPLWLVLLAEAAGYVGQVGGPAPAGGGPDGVRGKWATC